MNLRITFYLFILGMSSALSAVNHQVTVFIHGTCQAGLALLNPRRTWTDNFNGKSWFEITLADTRTDGYLEASDLMLGLGLTDVTDLIHKDASDAQVSHKAAIHSIRAYDKMSAHQATDKHHYYTFGWLGLMSESCREEASEQLYDALKALKEKFAQHGDTVQFTLQAHSHGGQVVFHLAQIRKERKDTDFYIDYAILSASPLYYPKAKHALSGMFKKIVHLYAPQDMIQIADCFSTPNHGCHRTFKDLGMPLPSGNSSAPLIVDVRLEVEGRSDILGHAPFFILDRYTVPHYIGWRKRKQIKTTLAHINPLPLIVLYPTLVPAIIKQAEQQKAYGYQSMVCNFTHTPAQDLLCELSLGGATTCCTFDQKALTAERQKVQTAYADTAYTTEAQKAFHSFKHVFVTLPKTKVKTKIVSKL